MQKFSDGENATCIRAERTAGTYSYVSYRIATGALYAQTSFFEILLNCINVRAWDVMQLDILAGRYMNRRVRSGEFGDFSPLAPAYASAENPYPLHKEAILLLRIYTERAFDTSIGYALII